MEQIISLISTFGFPIAMCLWFMFRTEKIIKLNTLAITDLTLMIKNK